MYVQSMFSYCSFPELPLLQKRDQVKKKLCKKNGITLLVVPYWWDMKVESLAQSIHAVRPDIELPGSVLKGNTIPDRMPPRTEYKRM